MGDLLVVDASVAVKWVLREAGRENAVALLSGGSVLIAPDVIRLELSNVITKRERRKAITSEQATEAFGLFTELSPELHQTEPLAVTAFNLARRSQTSFWDCIYLALAMEQSCGLVTADRRFFNAVAGQYPLMQLLDAPGSTWQH